MNKKRENLEKMIALLLLAYGIGLMVGEALRKKLYRGKKQKLYSGLFILLKHKMRLYRKEVAALLRQVWEQFRRLVHGFVRSHA